MIPLYIADVPLRGNSGLPKKNPIYFIRKSMGKSPADEYDMIVLNADHHDPQNFLPDLDYLHSTLDPNNAYDVEQVAVQGLYDAQVEPNAERDGSLAGAPRRVQSMITMTGFVRGDSFDELRERVKFLNYSFDPVINYLEGSSTFDTTVTPTWQTFHSVGFGVLAWFDPSALSESWRIESDPVNAADPFLQNEYARLNRFMFVRSVERPAVMDTKFSDLSVPFRIQLLAIDPSVYEFIAPVEFHSTAAAHHTLDESSALKILNGVLSDEVFVTPTEPWHFEGPGWREVTHTGETGDELFFWTWAAGARETVPAIASLGQPETQAVAAAKTGMTLNAGGWLEDDVGSNASDVPGAQGGNMYMASDATPGNIYHVEASIRIEGGSGLTPAIAIKWFSGTYGAYVEVSSEASLVTTAGSQTFTTVSGDFTAPVGVTAFLIVWGGNTWVDWIRVGEIVV